MPVPTIKRLKAGRIECTVTFEDGNVKEAEERAIASLGSVIKIDGFRAGKAPVDILKGRIKPEMLLEETIRNLLPDTIESLVKENALKPIIPPAVDVASASPLILRVTFIEKPEVKLKSVKKIAIEKKDATVDDKDVEQMVEYVLGQHQTSTDVDRPAKEHDRLTLDFYGEDERGTEIEGTRSSNYQVVIGSKMLIPGFEEELTSLKAGDTKDFTLTFPEKYQAEHLRGKPATFHVTVKRVEEMTKPELTDAFAKEKLGVASASHFKTSIRSSMQKQEEHLESERRESEAFEAIRKATEVDLAPELIENEKRTLLSELERELERRGVTKQQWLDQSGKTPEEIEKELDDRAMHRLQLQLGMEKYVDEKNIEVSDGEMSTAIEEFLKPLSDAEREKIAPAYAKGQRAYEQFKWKRTVEKAVAQLIE